jgi:glycosyltransferase involved in cell wall biosynthesis
MKIGAVTTAYNDESVIKGTLRCLKHFVDRHIVMLADKPFHGEAEKADNTEKICREEGVEVIKGYFPEHKQRNIGVSLCDDCDWVICFDADEVMTKEDLVKFIRFLETCKQGAVGAQSKVYWKTWDYEMKPTPDHAIIIAVRPTQRFWEKRCIDCQYYISTENDGFTHHHLSWSAPKDILSKVIHYNHANEFDGRKWYDTYFKEWTPGQKVYQPWMTEWTAEYNPLPAELKELYA